MSFRRKEVVVPFRRSFAAALLGFSGALAGCATAGTRQLPAPAAPQEALEPGYSLIHQVRVARAGSNVRSGPGSQYEIVLQLPQGSVLRVEAERGDWYQVALGEELGSSARTGYLHRSAVEEVTVVAATDTRHRDDSSAIAARPRPIVEPTSSPEPASRPARPVAERIQVTTRALAQEREGFWFSGGFGYGSIGCQECATRLDGFSGGLSLGGTVSRKVLLGVGTTGWVRVEDGVTFSAATLTANVRFYPSASGGFFLLGGLGYGSMSLNVGNYTLSEGGAGAVLGVGYDIRISRMTSLTPFWNGVGISLGDGTDANYGQIGLAISFH